MCARCGSSADHPSAHSMFDSPPSLAELRHPPSATRCWLPVARSSAPPTWVIAVTPARRPIPAAVRHLRAVVPLRDRSLRCDGHDPLEHPGSRRSTVYRAVPSGHRRRRSDCCVGFLPWKKSATDNRLTHPCVELNHLPNAARIAFAARMRRHLCIPRHIQGEPERTASHEAWAMRRFGRRLVAAAAGITALGVALSTTSANAASPAPAPSAPTALNLTAATMAQAPATRSSPA